MMSGLWHGCGQLYFVSTPRLNYCWLLFLATAHGQAIDLASSELTVLSFLTPARLNMDTLTQECNALCRVMTPNPCQLHRRLCFQFRSVWRYSKSYFHPVSIHHDGFTTNAKRPKGKERTAGFNEGSPDPVA
jgi:hypothetical protein